MDGIGAVGLIGSVAARYLGLSGRTLVSLANSGRIKSTRTAGGWRLFSLIDLEKFKREMHAKARRGAK